MYSEDGVGCKLHAAARSVGTCASDNNVRVIKKHVTTLAHTRLVYIYLAAFFSVYYCKYVFCLSYLELNKRNLDVFFGA